jgi:NMD protein affecting ribosome stability and mRNA decay
MLKARYGRKDRLIKQKRHDAYQDSIKLPEPTLCTKCNAVFSDGRWSWKKVTKHINQTICPACRRIEDNYPAGFINVKGSFFKEHRENVLGLIHNIEKQEKSDRPLERIMKIKEEKNQTLVTTTGIHVARRIGEALSRSFKGDLSFQYSEAEKIIRVNWSRGN